MSYFGNMFSLFGYIDSTFPGGTVPEWAQISGECYGKWDGGLDRENAEKTVSTISPDGIC